MAGIRFENVSKIFGNITAVNNANFEIIDKEFMVLVGPSGCGKSTLLRMIAGLEQISAGEIFIENKIVNDISPKDRDIAIVFQNYALYPHMTAYDNLAFGLKMRKLGRTEIRERVMEAAKILDIENLLDRKPKAMSGGQRQRVAIGRAIVRKPKVFLFDEPLSNLDAKLRAQMRVEIAALHKKLDTTIVYVTHDQVEAMTLGNRIAVMDKGEILQIDIPDRLYNFPQNLFVAGFIGTPPMNFIPGTIEKTTAVPHFWNESKSLKLGFFRNQDLFSNGQEIVIGIRAEHIKFNPPKDSQPVIQLRGIVRFIEKLGHEVFVFFDLDDTKMVARLSSGINLKPGATVSFFVDLEKIYYFDKKSGRRI